MSFLSLSTSTTTSTNRARLFGTAVPTRQDKHEAEEEIVTFLKLNNLSDNPGAVKKKRRVGRGIGSSKGKTCGRGHKGQKSRSGGNIHPSFEGGQTKFYKLLPKRGFNNKKFAQPMTPINLGTLQDYVTMGRLGIDGDGDNNNKELTIKDFVDAGILKRNSIKYGVKLLAKGSERFDAPLKLRVNRASRQAIEAVERAGGEVTTVHYNRLALRAVLTPEKFENGVLPKFARPPPKMMPYYLNWKRNRGYLSPQAQLRDLLKRRPELATLDDKQQTSK